MKPFQIAKHQLSPTKNLVYYAGILKQKEKDEAAGHDSAWPSICISFKVQDKTRSAVETRVTDIICDNFLISFRA